MNEVEEYEEQIPSPHEYIIPDTIGKRSKVFGGRPGLQFGKSVRSPKLYIAKHL